MKKKNLITTVASVALVGVIAVGSTLAYLSAQDGTLTNTFTFDNSLTIDLYESGNDQSDVGKGEFNVSNGIDYTNVVPNTDLTKEVKLDVTTNFDAYVYVNIQPGTEEGALMILDEDAIAANGWVSVNTDDNGYGIYRYEKTAVADIAKTLSVFDKVTVPDSSDPAETTLKDVVIDVFAMQSAGYDAVDADAEATEHFGA